ncbi:hypothetical protein AQF98_00470 [Pedobacter sp. Hv1]|nr:hypothetical protein AQF98_00470 [Pedobacter sp. Hv1]
MEQWHISCNGKNCQPELTSSEVKQPYPVLTFNLNGVNFFVEFDNQSDYMAAVYHKQINVTVVSYNRGKRFAGTAFNKK